MENASAAIAAPTAAAAATRTAATQEIAPDSRDTEGAAAAAGPRSFHATSGGLAETTNPAPRAEFSQGAEWDG